MIIYSIIQKSQLEGADRLDAEYYQPEYLELTKILNLTSSNQFRNITEFIKKGIFDISPERYITSGIPFVRVQNIKNGMIDETNLVFLSQEDHKKESKTELNGFDFVFSKVGTVGEVAFLNPKYKVWNFSQNVIGAKIKKGPIKSSYLLFFLLSKYGQLQIKRMQMFQVQPKLELEDIRNLKILRLKSENLFDDYLEKILSFQSISINLYNKAENLLLEELGLKDFQISEDLSYAVNYSDAEKINRIDADYFQPKYEALLSKIREHNPKLLGELVLMKKGFEPGSEAYQEEGRLFVRVSSLSKNGVEDKDQKYLSDELYERLKGNFKPQVGEVLLTKDATPGVAYVVKEPIGGIVSGGILRLKLKIGIELEYLALCINSIIGQMQAERDAGGSVIVHWKPEQIKNVLIPVLPKETQAKIADLVRKSHEARKKSKELLEEAKRRVEEMIEKGGD